MTTSDAMRATLSWLATYSVHSTLFLGSVWLALKLRPPRTNRSRERAWKLALVGGLISASVQGLLGARPLLGRLDWQPTLAAVSAPAADTTVAPRVPEPLSPAPVSAPEQAAETTREEPTPARTARTPRPERARASRTGGDVPGPARERAQPAAERAASSPWPRTESTATPLATRTSPEAAPPPEGAADGPPAEAPWSASLQRLASTCSERWPGWILAAWTAAGLLGLAGLAASWSVLRRRMLGRRILTEGALLARFETLRQRAGLRGRVRVSVSTRIRSPFSTGLLRPEVCLPEAVLTELTPAQQDALLAHELAHLLRRDPLWFGLGSLIEKVLFFQPLNRLARRQLAELAELACDDCAVRWTGARLALASCLTQVAGWVIGERPRLLAQPGLAGRSSLGRRVARLLDDRRSPSGEPPTPWWPPLAVGALALAALAVPGVAAVEAAPASALPAGPPAPPEEVAAETPLGLERRVPAGEPSRANPATSELRDQRSVLASELDELEAELELLQAELDVRDLRARFAPALERMEQRIGALRLQHERVRELLARLESVIPPERSAAPADRAPAPSPLSGASR